LDAQIALGQALLVTVPAPGTNSTTVARAARRARKAVAVLQAHGFAQEAVDGQFIVAALDVQRGNRAGAIACYQSLAQQEQRQVRIEAAAQLGALLPPAEALPYLRRAATLAVEQRRALPTEELQARYSSETSVADLRLAACYLAL